jgi:hypothetical protein
MNLIRSIAATAIGFLFCSCASSIPTANIESVELRDSIIAAAKAAQEAGGSELTYEASIAVSTETGAAVVVPIGQLAPSFSASRGTVAATKVTITVPIKSAAKQTPTRRVYQIDRQTLRTILKSPAAERYLGE